MKVSSEDVTAMNTKCVTCHTKEEKSMVEQWKNSTHFTEQVGCYTCHATENNDPIGYEHEGAFIKTIISPNDCNFCHSKAVKETAASAHANAGKVMIGLHNSLAGEVADFPMHNSAEFNNCASCHGSIITFNKDVNGKMLRNKETGAPIPSPESWPNSGVGRINPDGSQGSCNSCHSGHDFSGSLARQPENCAKCHSGDNHPQKGIYDASKHGIAYHSAPKGKEEGGMNIYKKGEWVLGKDYNAAPTCATCHMSAYRKSTGATEKATHNVGDRLSWSLSEQIAEKINRITFKDGTTMDVKKGENLPEVDDEYTHISYKKEGNKLVKIEENKEVSQVITWDKRRAKMDAICATCHSSSRVDNFYKQYDAGVESYNNTFAKPALMLVNELKKDKIWDTPAVQSGELVHIWFTLWHTNGKTAKNGMAMQSPNHSYWEGIHQVSKNFYTQFLPEVQNVANGANMGEKYKKLIQELLSKPEHKKMK
jgi:hypothetical protein